MLLFHLKIIRRKRKVQISETQDFNYHLNRIVLYLPVSLGWSRLAAFAMKNCFVSFPLSKLLKTLKEKWITAEAEYNISTRIERKRIRRCRLYKTITNTMVKT